MEKDSSEKKNQFDTSLRHRAEILDSSDKLDIEGLTKDELQKMVEEFRLYRIELEMQNEDLMKVQLELEESRSQYADLYDFAPVGYFTLDKNGIIFKANLTAAKLFGVEKDKLMQRAFGYFVSSEDQHLFSEFKKRLTCTSEPQTCELEMKNVKPKVLHVQLKGISICDNGQLDHYRIALVDVTEQKKSQEERKELEMKMQHTQKLESLGVMAGGIAHDFNNLLVPIMTNLELALEEIPNKKELLYKLLGEVKIGVERAADITNQLLDYSGKGKFVPKLIYLNKIIRELKNLMQISISKKISFHHDLDSELLPFLGDKTQIQQIIMNLISNAAESFADKQGGEILIRTSLLRNEELKSVNMNLNELNSDGCCISLEVTDNGLGMSEETKLKIFDPFFTTKFTGRGLGLASVLGIVRGHHGAIQVSSSLDGGTSFKIYFPCYEEESHFIQKKSKKSNKSKSWQGIGSILVVDDEPAIQKALKRMLTKRGFDTFIAEDGLEALEIFKKHEEQIKIILLDVTMPKMDGLEVVQIIRQTHSSLPIILMSGYNEDNIKYSDFKDNPLIEFIKKPFSSSLLLGKIQTLLEISTRFDFEE